MKSVNCEKLCLHLSPLRAPMASRCTVNRATVALATVPLQIVGICIGIMEITWTRCSASRAVPWVPGGVLPVLSVLLALQSTSTTQGPNQDTGLLLAQYSLSTPLLVWVSFKIRRHQTCFVKFPGMSRVTVWKHRGEGPHTLLKQEGSGQANYAR